MDVTISSVMQKNILTVNVDDPVQMVECLLNQTKLSFVPVIDGCGTCFGVISAPDLVHFHLTRKCPKKVRAWEICTHRVIEVGPEVSVQEAARIMIENQIHHLMVTEGEIMKGVVSSIDLLRYCLVDQSREAGGE